MTQPAPRALRDARAQDRPRGAPRSSWRASTLRTLVPHAWKLIALVALQVVAVHLVLHLFGPGLHPKVLLASVRQVTPTFAQLLLAGLAVRCVVEAARGRLRPFLRDVGTPSWLAGSAVLLLVGGPTLHAYSYLKMLVPLVHPETFDAALWTMDRWLFLGLSPGVFLVTLFSVPSLLRGLDWAYAWLYYPVLVGFLGFFLPLRSNRLRFAIAGGFAGLWFVGAWLYVLLPSLGPCYAFTELWAPVREHMPTSSRLQLQLMANYAKVLQIPQGMPASALDPALGIAAFPSLHVASQLYAALWVRRLAPRLGFVLFLTVGVLTVGSVVTGWHYLIDAVAGLLMAWVAYRLSARAWGLERWRRTGAAA